MPNYKYDDWCADELDPKTGLGCSWGINEQVCGCFDKPDEYNVSLPRPAIQTKIDTYRFAAAKKDLKVRLDSALGNHKIPYTLVFTGSTVYGAAVPGESDVDTCIIIEQPGHVELVMDIMGRIKSSLGRARKRGDGDSDILTSLIKTKYCIFDKNSFFNTLREADALCGYGKITLDTDSKKYENITASKFLSSFVIGCEIPEDGLKAKADLEGIIKKAAAKAAIKEDANIYLALKVS